MNFLKARSNRPKTIEQDALEEVPADGGTRPDEALERRVSAEFVHALLDQALDETEKKVFTLHYGDEVPLEAITRLLGLSNRSGAKAYIVSAKRKLRKAFQRWKASERGWDA